MASHYQYVYCNDSNNLVAARNEDRCMCRPGYIRTSAHRCESIFNKLNINVTGEGLGSSNVTVFSLIDSEWRVHSVFTQNTLYLLANLSLPEGRFAIRSAERIIYTFSESIQEADTVAAELAKNPSQFLTVNASSNDKFILVPTAHLRSYLVNLRVWFRPYKVECVDIPGTNQSDICSYSLFDETLLFKDGLYEFALSPLNTTVPVLYTVHSRPTTTAPLMPGMPGNSASVTSSPTVTIDRRRGITDTSTCINSTPSARSENSTDSTITTSRVNKLIMYSTLVTALFMTEIFAAITLIYITYQARN
ncbi:uncharacterized protein LOC135809303 [Sycon ciliatum]|uniref:uncharacterized protein LOC135809303 n=1 Tax=Sycon ciliatum TaxID=27933 RepID=UPI0031F61BA3